MKSCSLIRCFKESVYHVWNDYPMHSPESQRRHLLARQTWNKQPWTESSVPDASLPRRFGDAGGVVPYLRDVIDLGARNAGPDDVLVYTNADICVPLSCCDRILSALSSVQACYSHRFDFKRLLGPVPDAKVEGGEFYCGMDLFAFRRKWWDSVRLKMPDMLIGRQSWDSVLQHIIEAAHPGIDCAVSGLCYHEKHPSVWEDPKNHKTLPSQLHNINLAMQWCAQHGVNGSEMGIR